MEPLLSSETWGPEAVGRLCTVSTRAQPGRRHCQPSCPGTRRPPAAPASGEGLTLALACDPARPERGPGKRRTLRPAPGQVIPHRVRIPTWQVSSPATCPVTSLLVGPRPTSPGNLSEQPFWIDISHLLSLPGVSREASLCLLQLPLLAVKFQLQTVSQENLYFSVAVLQLNPRECRGVSTPGRVSWMSSSPLGSASSRRACLQHSPLAGPALGHPRPLLGPCDAEHFTKKLNILLLS